MKLQIFIALSSKNAASKVVKRMKSIGDCDRRKRRPQLCQHCGRHCRGLCMAADHTDHLWNMLGCKDPSSSQDGLTFLLPSPKRTFSSRITHTTMPWLSLVLLKDFWSIMSWLTQVVQLISYLLRPSDKCKSQKIRFMMLHILSVASEEDRS